MAKLAGGLEEISRALHIGPGKGGRVGTRAANELLAGKVHSGVRPAGQLLDQLPVANVALDETEPPVLQEIRQVARRRRASQRIEDGDQDLGVGTKPVADERRPEKAGATGDQEVADPKLRHVRKTAPFLPPCGQRRLSLRSGGPWLEEGLQPATRSQPPAAVPCGRQVRGPTGSRVPLALGWGSAWAWPLASVRVPATRRR